MSTQFNSFLKMYKITWNSKAKWSIEKQKLNIDGHDEIHNEFLITSHILLRICFRDCAYLLNQVPSKSIPLTPIETWNGYRPNLQHIHIQECPTHVLKQKVDKLEVRFEVCRFVSYPKGKIRHYFYNQVNHKVFVDINANFFKEGYMMSNKAKHDINWKALKDNLTLAQKTMIISCLHLSLLSILVHESFITIRGLLYNQISL